ncbi:VWA domain-containing protein [Corallococcus praedator]|uniref:VWA domain-containing protein n=1 Tax=Corallococcus praedator TaxID=2316724 RepID=A0ABX9QGL5_9BACT|nr:MULTISPECIES: vWA domain-containing protein [Corallococcus]RKH30984.1 VWA domain-containing protein [Corallococcus sp. CA031C]RKI07000.1 VWA domain-containing protein [Corallococcus praedator]
MNLKPLSRAVLTAALATGLSATSALAVTPLHAPPAETASTPAGTAKAAGVVAVPAPPSDAKAAPATKPAAATAAPPSAATKPAVNAMPAPPPAVKPSGTGAATTQAPGQTPTVPDLKVEGPVAPGQAQGAQPEIEVAFVLDTTGSMGGLLEGAKQKIFSIASRIAKGKPTPHLKVALVAYRDVGDAYVTKRFDLSDDLDAVFAELRKLQADGGGDSPEHVGRGLGEAVSLLKWNQNREVMKVIFLVGDAPPAQREAAWDFKLWSKRAKERHIVVNTVRCGGDDATEVSWRYVAKLTDGTFDSIDAAGGMVAVATPFDAELSRVNAELASKTLYAGRKEAQVMNRARADAMKSMAPEAAADRISYMKASRGAGKGGAAAAEVSSAPAAIGGAVDLLEKPAALAALKDDELPEELQGLKKEEQSAKVKQLATERKALEQQVAKLASDRDQWLTKNAPPKEDAFDANVMKSVKTQAAKFGVAY